LDPPRIERVGASFPAYAGVNSVEPAVATGTRAPAIAKNFLRVDLSLVN